MKGVRRPLFPRSSGRRLRFERDRRVRPVRTRRNLGRVTGAGSILAGVVRIRNVPRKQAHYIEEGTEIAMRPVGTLLAAFFKVPLFIDEVRSLFQDPPLKFCATIFDPSKFGAFICH